MYVRCLAAAVLAAASLSSAPAHAVGLGTSVGVGTGTFGGLGGAFAPRISAAFASRGFVPSLDLRFEPIHIQIHALEFLDYLANDGALFLGANGYYEVHRVGVADAWSGVVQPGVSLDIVADGDAIFAFAAECRLGVEAASAAGVGVYAVPAVGFVAGGGNAELMLGGGLQFSVWFGS